MHAGKGAYNSLYSGNGGAEWGAQCFKKCSHINLLVCKTVLHKNSFSLLNAVQ